jgi:hypothetical protein
MKYTGGIEGQYGSREDPKKLALIQEIPGNTGELVILDTIDPGFNMFFPISSLDLLYS